MLWRDLEVWQRAHALVLRIHRQVQSFPRDERYRLTDQLCRSAMSVPANIVEGQSRQTTKEYVQFLYQARGSVEETRYHLLLARDLGYLEANGYEPLEEDCAVVSKMINGLIQSLGRKRREGLRAGESPSTP
ncbi:MAG: four helix bundle protein [Nitrospirota bacterium]